MSDLGYGKGYAILANDFFIEYQKPYDPQEVYRVYLDGERIGLIYSKESFEDYIDNTDDIDWISTPTLLVAFTTSTGRPNVRYSDMDMAVPPAERVFINPTIRPDTTRRMAIGSVSVI